MFWPQHPRCWDQNTSQIQILRHFEKKGARCNLGLTPHLHHLVGQPHTKRKPTEREEEGHTEPSWQPVGDESPQVKHTLEIKLAQHLDLRCVPPPASLVPGVPTKTRLESSIQTLHHVSFMVWLAGLLKRTLRATIQNTEMTMDQVKLARKEASESCLDLNCSPICFVWC